MTREEARKAAEVMLAYADGKEIEFRPKCKSEWYPIAAPFFNWDNSDYRIMPEPTYRPFKNKEECWEEMQKHHPFGWLIDKNTDVCHTIVALNNVCPYFSSDCCEDYERLFKYAVFADGAPFGIKEE